MLETGNMAWQGISEPQAWFAGLEMNQHLYFSQKIH